MNLLSTPTNINQMMSTHHLQNVLNNNSNGGPQKTVSDSFVATPLSLISQANTNSAILAPAGTHFLSQKNFYNLQSNFPLQNNYPFKNLYNETGEESSNGDEIKNFRNQVDSLSASSRPGKRF